jgi:hypothetical protein
MWSLGSVRGNVRRVRLGDDVPKMSVSGPTPHSASHNKQLPKGEIIALPPPEPALHELACTPDRA